ncbi:disulfide isomerase DsbC N-terminal domain-containing protein [Ligilactobacillus salivarius]|nr:disulfide isomerase DsbC N-terminal domain-containing protein [Ligilactobacillus salivarius]
MKKGFMLFTLLAEFSGFAQADDAAIQQTLAKMGIKSSDIQPAPVAGMKTVLTNSGVLYITDDGKHIIQGPMYDVSGTAPVNVTNKMLLKQLNASPATKPAQTTTTTNTKHTTLTRTRIAAKKTINTPRVSILSILSN